MLRIDLLHLVICAIPLISGYPDVSIAHGTHLPSTVSSATTSTAQQPLAETTSQPLNNNTNRYILATLKAPHQINPPNKSQDNTVETSTTNKVKSFISLGPLQILGFLFKASNKTHKFNLTSLGSGSLGDESSLLGSGSSDQLPGEGKIDGRSVDLLRAAARLAADAKTLSPYEHWDVDSAEQEAELHIQSTPHQQQSTVDEPAPVTSTTSISRSYLLLLAGNATIVRLRQKDFAKYLKMNLAARLSLEYDDVKVNTVVVAPPRLVVNVSVLTPETSSEAADIMAGHVAEGNPLNEDTPLHMLAETNATLLELSGEEYHVVRLLPLRSDPLEVDEDLELSVSRATTADNRHSDIELVIYTVLGGICFLIIFTALLRIAVRRYRSLSDKLWFMPTFFLPWSPPRQEPMTVSNDRDCLSPPTVIYSGSFVSPVGRATPQPNWMQHIYQSRQPNIIIQDPTPVFAEVKRPFDIDISHLHHPSPSKLHIFSCRPGTVVIPLPYQHLHTDNVRGLDVREDPCLGHDNPNYRN